MPRRKKNGQSPARVPGGGPLEGGSLNRLPPGFDGAMANNFASSTSLSSSEKENIVQSMQEMFSHLDPEVIYIVLSECDFKVENAMDSLLELSVAAEVAAPMPSHVSGFELTAAALLRPLHFSEPRPDSSKPPQLPSPPSTNFLTEELDLLVDQELETLTAQQCAKEDHHSSPYLSVGMSLSSFPPPPFPQQVLPELLQSSMQPGSRGSSGGGPVDHISGASSPLDQLSIWEDEMVEKQQSRVDFTHLMTQNPADKTKSPLDLAASGRPSAFQVYKKQDPLHTLPDSARVMPSKAIVGGARSKDAQACLSLAESEPGRSGTTQTFCYYPKVLGTVCWATPPPQYSRLRLEGRVLVLLRGPPGSGKSTLARALLEHNRGGVILSTDNYFTRHGEYQFDPTALGEAHEWNHKQAKEAFERGANPIIIDNTNMQGWEMKPYVAQALKNGYKVLFREPDTWWKSKPRELERRTKHDVPLEKIRRMLNSYERYVTVQSIMGSQMPEVKQRLAMENRSPQPVASETPRPDLVGQPGLTDGFKPRPQLFSSLPDVSSIGRSGEVGMLEDGPNEYTESLNLQHTESFTEHPEINDEEDSMDLGELDSELDAQIDSNLPIGDQRIPDCIVESVMSEGHHGDELSVAFSESIAQRVRRERPSRRSDFDRSEPADVVKDTNQSDSEAKEKEKSKEAEGVEIVRDGREKGRPYMLDFVGDWPSEGSLEQRQVRRSEKHEEANGKKEEVSQEAQKKKTKVQSGSNVTEFQKLLDLIQTGVADIQTDSSRSSSLSPTPREEWEKEEEAAVYSNPPTLWRQVYAMMGKQATIFECEVGTEPETRVELIRVMLVMRVRVLCVKALTEATTPKLNLKTLPSYGVSTIKNSSDDAVATGDITVLSGDSFRFAPERSSAVSAAVAVHHSGQREVPYHVAHEKGTQVEEKDIGSTQDQLESLRILSPPFQTDLYDKCHQDLEWTTNLLLDSGERFFREDDGGREEEDGGGDDDEQITSSLFGALDKPVGNSLCPNALDEHHPEGQPKGEQHSEQSTSDTVRESDESNNNTDVLSLGGAAVQVQNKEHPDTTSHLERSLQTELSLPHGVNEGGRCGVTEHKVASEAVLEGGVWGQSSEDGVIIEESRVEIEEEIASMEESVELKLPTELALQLTELFGPVGVDPGSCPTDDYAVKMDLHLAKLLHQKWKETIQTRQGRADLDLRDGAAMLKENQLFALFPTIDRHFLQDIFRDHNYSLIQTELFLRSLLDEGPVKTVVAPEPPRSDHLRAASKEREKRQKPPESTVLDYQDTEDPDYQDFRAEASQQRERQLQCFSKAAEAYKQGRKQVASFYAQQGHLHGQQMREANHRAAVQIFEKVNSSLLPSNILDLHGLHVDEALQHLAQVLQVKTTDCEQGLCRPQLSVITGRGNHSQGGVARIRPAVIDYLTNKSYRYTHTENTHTNTHKNIQAEH
ncbi:hypothetical protein KUCAC02_015378 [Chaenocephalus aceratus]|uniref:Uncharacterized protein n=1 Tax=Chaenocephalus aceratus TaxID=36190 RepID=A0ACB9XYW0_CHAAC|nr:hypothetical protein KUCAC02_015378 [Chaenocephalus aceratus]